MRFVVAGGVAVIVACGVLAAEHQRSPFRDHRWKAVWWWGGLVMLDVGVAVLAVGIASETGSGSAGDLAGWVLIGVFAPLGVRSPVWKNRELFGRQVDAGITYIYDIAHTGLTVGLDRRMAPLRVQARRVRTGKILARNWTYPTLLVYVEQDIRELHKMPDDDKDTILTKAYLLSGLEDEHDQLNGLIKIILDNKLGILDDICSRDPGADEIREGANALDRAQRSLRLEEAGPQLDAVPARREDLDGDQGQAHGET